MNQFLFPGFGHALRKAKSATDASVFEPETTLLANNDYTETFAGQDGRQTVLNFTFAAAATGNVQIEICDSQNASSGGSTFDTVAVSAQRAAIWTGEALIGHFRVKNESGQVLVVTRNVLIN